MIKRLISQLPLRFQQELKRLHLSGQISRGIFTTAETADTEFPRLAGWVRAGDWVLDVGANLGNYTARLSELVGRDGRVLAFEPVPETFELLAANLARFPLRNVSFFNVAVSDTPGVSGITIPQLDSGLENRYMAHLTDGPSEWTVYRLPVDALAIPHRVSFVKVDVEGHELPALRGMHGLLERDHPVLVVEGRDDDVASYLGRLGYTFADTAGSPNRVFTAGSGPGIGRV